MSLYNSLRRKLLLFIWRLITKAGYEIRKESNNAERDMLEICPTNVTKMIFDVGCNEGVTTERYRKLYPNAQIHAFEALPDICDAARQRHADASKLKIHNLAVSEVSGKISFNRNKAADSSSALESNHDQLPESYREIEQTVEKLTVDSISIDDFCSTNSIEFIDILKLDIQGSELSALKGCRKLLSQGRIRAIYTEIYFLPFYKQQPLFEDIAAYLASHNYKFLYPYGLVYGSKTGRLQWGDAIFTSPDVTIEKGKWILG